MPSYARSLHVASAHSARCPNGRMVSGRRRGPLGTMRSADCMTLLRGPRPLGLVGALLWLATNTSQADTYVLRPGADVVGEIGQVKTRRQDTLVDIARLHGVGYEAIKLANPGVDPWIPGGERWIRVPRMFVLPSTPREGIVLNLPEMRLYYYLPRAKGGRPLVMTYPVSIGSMDWSTPLGLTRVLAKVRNPTWRPPPSVRAEYAAEGTPLPAAVPPGPDNALGEYALRLAVPGYLIHGTNQPYGIGMRVTHGCVRLYPEDIETLFREVPKGTPVRIIDQPYKAGWRDGVLYFESHPVLHGKPVRNFTPAVRAILAATAGRRARIDWDKVQQVAEDAHGIPTPVSR